VVWRKDVPGLWKGNLRTVNDVCVSIRSVRARVRRDAASGDVYLCSRSLWCENGLCGSWTYNPTNDTFQWIHGSNQTSNANIALDAIYPAKGVPTATALPYGSVCPVQLQNLRSNCQWAAHTIAACSLHSHSRRYNGASAVDSAGRLWLHGGMAYSTTSTRMNDLWSAITRLFYRSRTDFIRVVHQADQSADVLLL
jgi:hypothetical protein